MKSFIDWLNANVGAVSAMAGLLSAVATVAIAIFSYGTWKLYQLQLRSLNAMRVRVSVHILNMVHVTWSYMEIIKEVMDWKTYNRKQLSREMHKILDTIPNFRADIKSLLSDPGIVDPKAIGLLNVASERLFQAREVAETIFDTKTPLQNLPDLLVDLFKRIESAGVALMGARIEITDVDSLVTGSSALDYPMYFYYLAGEKHNLSSDEEIKKRIEEMSERGRPDSLGRG